MYRGHCCVGALAAGLGPIHPPICPLLWFFMETFQWCNQSLSCYFPFASFLCLTITQRWRHHSCHSHSPVRNESMSMQHYTRFIACSCVQCNEAPLCTVETQSPVWHNAWPNVHSPALHYAKTLCECSYNTVKQCTLTPLLLFMNGVPVDNSTVKGQLCHPTKRSSSLLHGPFHLSMNFVFVASSCSG